MNYPAASCEVSNPRLRTPGSRQFGGRYSCGMRTLEPPQLDVLAMQLGIAFFAALLPHILANDGFIPVPAYRTDARALGPQLSSPQTFFDGRNAVQELTGREALDALDHLGRARARPRLHQTMDVLCVRAKLSKGYCVPLGDVSADLFKDRIDFGVKDDAAILRRTHDRVKQGRAVVPCMSLVAHASDHTTTAKAEASFEESDPID